jgi:hypothetical protein
MMAHRWLAAAFALAVATPASGCAGSSEADDGSTSSDVTESKIVIRAGIERQRAAAAKKDASVEDRERAAAHLGNAYALVRLANASYHPDAASVRADVTSLGVPANSIETFVNTCTHAIAYYAKVGDAAVVAFRGTEPNERETVVADLVSFKTLWEGAGLVHAGFLYDFQSLWHAHPECGVDHGLGEYVAARHRTGPNGERIGGELYLTGHSLGAALATLALAQTYADVCGPIPVCMATPKIPVSALYTFGSPKVGETVFAVTLGELTRGRTEIFRFVHKDDAVTMLPRNLNPLEFAVYRPVGTVLNEDAFTVWYDDKDMSIAEAVLHVAWNPDDHMPNTYPPGIAAQAKKRGEL